MSRITKWKLEKTKVKVVFRLQFHATNIPHSRWDKLFISFIPADTGKATAKTTKANVRNGTCKWADPIYETTRLLQDNKTKQYDERFYKLVVAMGSSRSSILGEGTINLADYADALKPYVVALPLHGCDCATTLHVTVQLLTSKTGFREFEQQRELRERGLQTCQNSPDESSGGKVSSSSEETINDQMDKLHARVRFKEKSKDHSSLEEEAGPNEDYADSAVGFDGSSNTSESLYVEKHDISSAHEIDGLKSSVIGDLAVLSLNQGPQLKNGDPSDHRFLAQGIHGWSSDYSADNDLAAAYEENSRLRGSLEVAESSILKLKLEVNSLQSHADEIGCEAQKFAKQLASEISSGLEMAKEVSLLKSECSNLKEELEGLNVSKLCLPFNKEEGIRADKDHVFQDLHLRWLNGLFDIEDKIRQLQNKANFGYEERDVRLLHADLDMLLNALNNLKQADGIAIFSQKLVPSDGAIMKEIEETTLHNNGQVVAGTGFDMDMYQPELGMLQSLSIPALVSHDPDSKDAVTAMKGKIFELLRELEESKTEQESLAKKMNQMECYYEALVQELEENQRQLLGELQSLRNEHSTCLCAVSSTRAEMEAMRQDLDSQILRFVKEKQDLDSLNKEIERRAITAEAALKRARLNYSIAVGQLQKDLELLSCQVLSMFETKENLIRQALVDATQLSFEEHLGEIPSQKFESEEFQSVKLLQLHNHSFGVKKQHLGGDILLDDLKRSLQMQEGLYRKVEEEACEMHSVNIYLDVFSRTLEETLVEASEDIKLMKEKINQLTQQLKFSTKSEELLIQNLQTATEEVRSLNEHKATSVAKCNDMALQIQILEANLQNVTGENLLLTEKIMEWESLLMQYRGYESQLESCMDEKTELEHLLEKKTLENVSFQNEIFSLKEESKTAKTEFDALASAKDNLQNFSNFLQNKLRNLLIIYGNNIDELISRGDSENQDLASGDITVVLMQLEELQCNAFKKILQLTEEKKGLMHERDIAHVSITAAQSEIAQLKQKFENDVRHMVDKFDVSNALMQKLQLRIEVIADKLKVNSEVEEKYAQQHNELFSDLDLLEFELQELSSKNRELAQEVLTLGIMTTELERTKFTAAELSGENQVLMSSLRDKNEESTTLAMEVKSLKESLQCLCDENKTLTATLKDKMLEATQLASELNSLKETCQSLCNQNQLLTASLQDKTNESANLASELNSLTEKISMLHDKNQALAASSQGKTEESANLAAELNSLKENLQSLHDEKQAFMASSQNKFEESAKLALELNRLKESLQSLHDENQALTASLQEKEEESAKLALELHSLNENLQEETEQSAKFASEVNSLKEALQSLHDEKQALVASSQDKSEESAKHALELDCLKKDLQSLQDENQALVASSHNKTEESVKLSMVLNSLEGSLQHKMEESNQLVLEVNCLKENLQSLHDEKQALMVSSQDIMDESAVLASEVNRLKESLQSLHDENQVLVARSQDKSEESAKLALEVNSLKECLQSLHEEREALIVSSRDSTEESAKFVLEVNSLRASMQLLNDELHDERNSRLKLENTITNLKQLVSDVESEKSRVCSQLLHYEDCLRNAQEESSLRSDIDAQLSEMYELFTVADVEFIFMKAQYEGRIEELVQHLHSSDVQLVELHNKHLDVECALERCLVSEAHHIEENIRLLTSVNSFRSDLEASIGENRLLAETNRIIRAELVDYKNKIQNVQLSHYEDKNKLSLEVERLKCMLVTSEEEIDNLMLFKEKLEVNVLVLKAKLVEQQTQMVALEGYYDELMMMQKQCSELNQRLSEQILKTEEFRNLSVHLKELKDKAEADCIHHAREKRGPEGPPTAMQESLRIAFIKEQCETKVQELKRQLSISKRHGEEMLLKLQDSIDEIENRKKSEVSLLKKNEELGRKILELEAELQLLLSEKREKTNAYDLMKAEMECALISLECCKEEKQKLEASLQDCIEEKTKIGVQLTLMQEYLESSKSTINIPVEGNDVSCKVDCNPSSESVFRNVQRENVVADKLSRREKSLDTIPQSDTAIDFHLKNMEQDGSIHCQEAEHACTSPMDEVNYSNTAINLLSQKDVLLFGGVNCLQSPVPVNQETLCGDMKHLALINDNFRAESLRSTMDHLSNELERMKNENSLFTNDDHDFDQKFPGLERELVKLQKANEELGSMFPSFNEFSERGNALERVLALEIELAESLQAKKKSSIQFQSSFLKQHSDEEAIFKSFRDINELIKDMLDVKGRYAAVETELKEMHNRYSQLSLQFAEVEGERQKLMMTLKNIRASKRGLCT